MPPNSMFRHYKLEGKLPVPCDDILEWAIYFENTSRQVALTHLSDATVSTVFLGLDHGFYAGRVLLFETMVFGGNLDQQQRRYGSWEEAENGHEEMVSMVAAQSCQN